MLLHEHPLNTQRQAHGLLPVNSFWLSGCGVARPAAAPTLQVDHRLRSYALAEDWAGWAKAWAVIDDGLPTATIEQLTLCGERSSTTWALAPRGLLQRLVSRWSKPDPIALLEAL